MPAPPQRRFNQATRPFSMTNKRLITIFTLRIWRAYSLIRFFYFLKPRIPPKRLTQSHALFQLHKQATLAYSLTIPRTMKERGAHFWAIPKSGIMRSGIAMAFHVTQQDGFGKISGTRTCILEGSVMGLFLGRVLGGLPGTRKGRLLMA